jgi:myo-inositol-1(or 4)-monophosphatase
MTTIHPTYVIEQLRIVGATLKQTFIQMEAVIEPADMMAAFRLIDGDTLAALKTRLTVAYPSIAWSEDEFSTSVDGAPTGDYWICDAIDGAVQFLRAIPQWCISLTLVREGRPVFAAVYDVMHGELFHAVAGAGAFLNGEAMRVNGRQTHVGGLLAGSQPPFINHDTRATTLAGASLTALLREAGALRNLGPTSLQLAYVACGRLDGFWEFGEDGVNCLGGSLLVREAGGAASDVAGAPYGLTSDSIVAAPKAVQATMLVALAKL